ncbi:MAG: SDR family oxidoreductase [Candidatus Kerfeldbacteria bacterium RIFCSPHIGHO2_02_FULL_42_14]|uniref:SDR family oxidoreductase n=1 Tax=Candidatus Kerfeldbacteria bacterium RIFCSPHIGHO2_02_FULL_42_14 TaxID=1798540 RepID=A0A1G2AS90_9BACT|nr:MAG: SDR family oxidoreductase [Candidatus Kerfeldbacteria bacterium RIFCSPHIGHO2_02_FULL_42_14]OGY81927.1 MAG: SDR family oxidoreductase [Candidatus Kerfeldbacteria bacterium RIFCSPHIGHO2_12_FULL_42_13]OGY83438.1 MAG: SDR family oxidoreductase [Candidatus Kerfeldbacteria bacterium RIFCSPLOWO2_02_FULL_42_19]
MGIIPLAKLCDLSGRTAIVTGGAVGIGYGIAYRLAEAGTHVMIADMHKANVEKAKQILRKHGWSVEVIVADVSQLTDVKKIVEQTVKFFGSIDILVNNAGIYSNILVMNMSAEDFDKVIAVNLKSVFLCTKIAAKQMISQGRGGRIINITSVDALHPSSVGFAHYDASKHGVWGFTKNIALELAPHKIWVNAVAPGGILTPGVQAFQKQMKLPQGVDAKKLLEAFLAKIPMKRMGEPDDIGKAVLFLASDMSSYMTGSQIVVDGGVLLS